MKLVIFDVNSLLHRAFHALPPLTTARGEPTNAVYGLLNMLNRILEQEQPDMLAACMDSPGPTFRHQQYAEYKATRERAPDELTAQMATAKEALQALRIPLFEMQGYEADDLVGAIARRASEAGHDVTIISGDLDMLQLVSDNVRVMTTRRGVTDTVLYDRRAVRARFGLQPEQLVDFRALKGDSTDNIPGVPGIGEKTASKLIGQFGSVETILSHPEKVEDGKIAQALSEHRDQIMLARSISRIATDMPLELDLDSLRREEPDRPTLEALLRRLEFRTLAERLLGADQASGPGAADVEVAFEGRALSNALTGLRTAGHLYLHLVTDKGDSLSPALAAAVLKPDSGAAVFLPVTKGAGLFDHGKAAGLEQVRDLLESGKTGKSVHDAKQAYLVLKRLDIELRGVAFDPMIASYLLDPSRPSHALDHLALEFLDQKGGEILAPLQAGDLRTAAAQAALRAHWVQQLERAMRPRMQEHGLEHLFGEVELPLAFTLAHMELRGAAIDVPFLNALSDQMGKAENEIQQRIYELAGQTFNISSPKQLQALLFDKLGLPRGKRTKTGYSTDVEVLGELAKDHEIVAKILQYRELSKLRSTYVDALPRLVHPETGRVHTSLNQTVTATGRLSSSEPNLQNVPVRTELGRQIRRAFVAGAPGHVLLSADYSQIELRILAHICGDQHMRAIFAQDQDMHSATACEIFGVSPQQVTPEMRRLAKVVNFGIPYGISAQGLARDMGIPVEEAAAYMVRYFERFPGVREYVDTIVEQAGRQGYVTTLLGRRRYLPDLDSPSRPVREFAARTAINTPIQGSAADLIKVAMLRVERSLREAALEACMILQVHDELLFEVRAEHLAQAAQIIKREMEAAFPLDVPLKVEAKAGPNWAEMSNA
jgi:DNA polymerase-1